MDHVLSAQTLAELGLSWVCRRATRGNQGRLIVLSQATLRQRQGQGVRKSLMRRQREVLMLR